MVLFLVVTILRLARVCQLMRSAGGADWKRNRNWGLDETVAFDAWEGVVGVDVGKPGEKQYQRCVGELWLGDNGLAGALPPVFAWQGVPHLAVLELQFNRQLGGQLPQLLALKRLVVLDVRGCRLDGRYSGGNVLKGSWLLFVIAGGAEGVVRGDSKAHPVNTHCWTPPPQRRLLVRLRTVAFLSPHRQKQ